MSKWFLNEKQGGARRNVSLVYGKYNMKLELEDMEQIETLLGFVETDIQMAHYQQHLKLLYDIYLQDQRGKRRTKEELRSDAKRKIGNWVESPIISNLLSGEEFGSLDPYEQGWVSYMQASWDESPIQNENPYITGDDHARFNEGAHHAMIQVTEI